MNNPTYTGVAARHIHHAPYLLVEQEFLIPPKRTCKTPFDDPDALSRASEGFCPFRHHQGHEVAEPVRLELMPDGRLLCPVDNVAMCFEWGILE